MRIHYRSFVQVNEYNILSRRTDVFLKLRTGLLWEHSRPQSPLFILAGGA